MFLHAVYVHLEGHVGVDVDVLVDVLVDVTVEPVQQCGFWMGLGLSRP